MRPVKDKDALKLYFIMPQYYEKMHSKNPMSYVSNIIGHEGENSLLSYLISEGLALSLSSGGSSHLNGFSYFMINIDLTKKGLANYEQVIEACYQFNQNLRDAGPQQYMFDELLDVGKINFEF